MKKKPNTPTVLVSGENSSIKNSQFINSSEAMTGRNSKYVDNKNIRTNMKEDIRAKNITKLAFKVVISIVTSTIIIAIGKYIFKIY